MLSRLRLSPLRHHVARMQPVPKRPTINMQMNRIPGSGSTIRQFADRAGHWYYTKHGNARYVTNAILIANAAVFFTWQFASVNQNRWLRQKLSENFVLSWTSIKAGKYWTVITSAFSHNNLGHFVFNCIAFNAFAGLICAIPGVGGMTIAGLALGSAITGSVAFLAQDREKARTSIRGALGASGMVCGFSAAATCLVPTAPMHFFFIPIAIPLWACTAVFLGVDLFYLDDASSRVGHAAHLGGFGFGLAYYALSMRRFGGILRLGNQVRRRF